MDWNMFCAALTWSIVLICAIMWLSFLVVADTYPRVSRMCVITTIASVPVAVLGIALIAGMGWY